MGEICLHKDHMFGAVNLPVLSNEQRVQVQLFIPFFHKSEHTICHSFIQVGSLYHKDRMAGRKLGAALITANISKVKRYKTMDSNNIHSI